MNEKEFKLRLCELDARLQEIAVRDAKIELDQGYNRLMAEFEKGYALLKNAYDRQVLRLERECTFVEFAKDEIERGFRT